MRSRTNTNSYESLSLSADAKLLATVELKRLCRARLTYVIFSTTTGNYSNWEPEPEDHVLREPCVARVAEESESRNLKILREIRRFFEDCERHSTPLRLRGKHAVIFELLFEVRPRVLMALNKPMIANHSPSGTRSKPDHVSNFRS
jgi:hypothetical protein